MKHKIIVLSAACTVACVIIGASLCHLHGGPTEVTLSLVAYTNDTALHSAFYGDSTPANARTAVFALTNQTRRHTFMYFHGNVQIRTQHVWADETNWLSSGDEITPLLGPGQRTQIRFPDPAGSNAWRCSVKLLDISYFPTGSGWKRRILDMIRDAHINLVRTHTQWSAEVAR